VARIAGVDLPPSKRVEIGLTYIYGIGRTRALGILEKAKVEPAVKVKDLSEDELLRITRVLNQEGRVEGDLRKAVGLDIKRLIEIGSYRGMRHRRNLPCRGQRTHTNARTRRGPRRAIAGKKHKTGKKG
jgi:small subunit ribosomal protein S13